MSSVSGRIALVTGASRGIGAATALALGKAGAHVVAVARTVGGLEELDDEIRKLGGSATLVPLDMTDADGARPPAIANGFFILCVGCVDILRFDLARTEKFPLQKGPKAFRMVLVQSDVFIEIEESNV